MSGIVLAAGRYGDDLFLHLAPDYPSIGMVRLVLVSHSRALANDLIGFVRQMAGDDVRIDVAAGTGDDGDEFGTDVTAIVDAITSGPVEDGVVLLADVGSAVMSAEMALEFLDEDVRTNVRLSSAPFVEGTLSAAVQASLGNDIDTVCREAESALQQKLHNAGAAASPPPQPAVQDPTRTADSSSRTENGEDPDSGKNVVTATVSLPNPHGLHARPAAQFVRAAAEFNAEITVENRTAGRGPVPATSISSVTRLGAGQGHELHLRATGPEASTAVEHLSDLIADGFGEMSNESETAVAASGGEETSDAEERGATNGRSPGGAGVSTRHGTPVSTGVVLGPAHVYRPSLPDLPDEPSGPPDEEWERVVRAVAAVRDHLDDERAAHQASGSGDAAGILDAQRLLLDDDALIGTVRRDVRQNERPAARAWIDAVESVADDYAAMEDAYLAERAADVRDVGRRVAREILDAPNVAIEGPDEPFVLVATSLVPSDVHALPDAVRGVVCAAGNPASHAAILLRSRGLPAVFDAGPDVMDVEPGTRIGLDGEEGRVWTQVSDDLAGRLQARIAEQENRQSQLQQKAQSPPVTMDGAEFSVAANVNHSTDAATAHENGADGVGLLRTEFLFVNQDEPPTEDEQVDHLRTVARVLDGRPVTVRALDVGGDKPIGYVPLPSESNPFLGLRGIRVLLRHPSLFRTQIRAVLRVAADHPVRFLLPMVATPSEIRRTRALIAEVADDLSAGARDASASLPVGVMIETPASAVAARSLAEAADFFSIGTNDLTQYTMAADRESSDLADLSDALHPPVLHLIRQVVIAAHDASIPVSVCGEIAADIFAVPVLAGLGVRHLSVAPPSVPRIKAALRALSVADAEALAGDSLTAEDADAVRALSRRFWSSRDLSFLSTHPAFSD